MNTSSAACRAAAWVFLLLLLACGGDDPTTGPAPGPVSHALLDGSASGISSTGVTGDSEFAALHLQATLDLTSSTALVVGAPADAQNVFPFGGRFDTRPGTRYQQAYAAAEFAARGPILIESVAFMSGSGNIVRSTYTFFLSTITTGINALSNLDFDGNRGANNARFASVELSGVAPPTLTIQGDVPFLYDPAQGNLLLDIVVSPGGVTSGVGVASFAARMGTAGGIFSRYHDFGTANIGWGLVTKFELAPLTIDNLVAVVDDAIAAGTLVGQGPGLSAPRLLELWRRMLETAQRASQEGDLATACTQLEHAYLRGDGDATKLDFAGGAAAPALAALIQAIRDDLGC